MSTGQNQHDFLLALNRHKGIIYKVANSYSKSREDRNDLIQEITLHLWRSWQSYDSDFKLSTWIYKIALNVAISFYRKNYRNKDAFTPPWIAQETSDLEDEQEERLTDNIRQLYQFIAELNELNKALMLLYLDQYSYEKIAHALGISKTNVSTKISRIKKQLKKKFEKKVQNGFK